jgi:hypothetical protein
VAETTPPPQGCLPTLVPVTRGERCSHSFKTASRNAAKTATLALLAAMAVASVKVVYEPERVILA